MSSRFPITEAPSMSAGGTQSVCWKHCLRCSFIRWVGPQPTGFDCNRARDRELVLPSSRLCCVAPPNHTAPTTEFFAQKVFFALSFLYLCLQRMQFQVVQDFTFQRLHVGQLFAQHFNLFGNGFRLFGDFVVLVLQSCNGCFGGLNLRHFARLVKPLNLQILGKQVPSFRLELLHFLVESGHEQVVGIALLVATSSQIFKLPLQRFALFIQSLCVLLVLASLSFQLIHGFFQLSTLFNVEAKLHESLLTLRDRLLALHQLKLLALSFFFLVVKRLVALFNAVFQVAAAGLHLVKALGANAAQAVLKLQNLLLQIRKGLLQLMKLVARVTQLLCLHQLLISPGLELTGFVVVSFNVGQLLVDQLQLFLAVFQLFLETLYDSDLALELVEGFKDRLLQLGIGQLALLCCLFPHVVSSFSLFARHLLLADEAFALVKAFEQPVHDVGQAQVEFHHFYFALL
eukprot:m.52038 g.52038  ORF g.52038 m.52038 type:complete len:458 (+) comp12263_c0_seq2:857-2230(+)